MCVLRQYTCTCVNCVSCGIYMYVCVSEYVHNWQIHGSNVNEVNNYYMKSYNIEINDVTSNLNETHLDTILIATTSFHLCELEGINFPMTPHNATIG